MAYKLQPADMRDKWEEYRRQCDEHIETVRYRDKLVQVPKKIIYTLEGFCLFLDLSEEDLKKYEDNKNYRAIVKKIRYLVMCRKMHALVNGEGNARALIYDLKVNHGIDPKEARQEEGWQITLNLNHDNEEVWEDKSPKGRKKDEEWPPNPGDGVCERNESYSTVNYGNPGMDTITPAYTPPELLPKPKYEPEYKPEKMNPYSVW